MWVISFNHDEILIQLSATNLSLGFCPCGGVTCGKSCLSPSFLSPSLSHTHTHTQTHTHTHFHRRSQLNAPVSKQRPRNWCPDSLGSPVVSIIWVLAHSCMPQTPLTPDRSVTESNGTIHFNLSRLELISALPSSSPVTCPCLSFPVVYCPFSVLFLFYFLQRKKLIHTPLPSQLRTH